MEWVKISRGWVQLEQIAFIDVPPAGDGEIWLAGGKRVDVTPEDVTELEAAMSLYPSKMRDRKARLAVSGVESKHP